MLFGTASIYLHTKAEILFFLLQHAGHVCRLTLKMQCEVQTTEVMETFAPPQFVNFPKAVVSSWFFFLGYTGLSFCHVARFQPGEAFQPQKQCMFKTPSKQFDSFSTVTVRENSHAKNFSEYPELLELHLLLPFHTQGLNYHNFLKREGTIRR